MDKFKIGLIFGGRSQEHEISIMSARSVFHTVDPEKYRIIPFAISKKGYWLTPEKSLQILQKEDISEACCAENGSISVTLKHFLESELDLVFPVLHGPYGEDGRLQGMLEMLDIPYVGTGVLSSAASMDKAIMKKLFAFHDLPQGQYISINKFDLNITQDKELSKLKEVINEKISWPCFIKPANMGSSIGISKIHNSSELVEALHKAYKCDYKIIIEEYIPGREIECSVLGNKKIKASLPGEIRPGHEFYDYDAKYKDQSTDLIIPAKLDEEMVEKVRELAIQAFKAVDGRGLARVDFFIKDNGNILINEINTIPGFTRYSMYPKLWEVTGIKYSDLIDKLIELAVDWYNGLRCSG